VSHTARVCKRSTVFNAHSTNAYGPAAAGLPQIICTGCQRKHTRTAHAIVIVSSFQVSVINTNRTNPTTHLAILSRGVPVALGPLGFPIQHCGMCATQQHTMTAAPALQVLSSWPYQAARWHPCRRRCCCLLVGCCCRCPAAAAAAATLGGAAAAAAG
jgi:hypothetical protein